MRGGFGGLSIFGGDFVAIVALGRAGVAGGKQLYGGFVAVGGALAQDQATAFGREGGFTVGVGLVNKGVGAGKHAGAPDGCWRGPRAKPRRKVTAGAFGERCNRGSGFKSDRTCR